MTQGVIAVTIGVMSSVANKVQVDWQRSGDGIVVADAGPAPSTAGRDWKAVLSEREIRELHRVNNLRGLWSLAVNWGIVAAAMALVAAWPNLLTVVFALFVIGARQLGFAVLMHEASHGAFLSERRANDLVSNWLCAYPVWSDIAPYRPYHLEHHRLNWTDEDPDRNLTRPFPISRASMKRKLWRDLSGQTGWKRAKATLQRDLSISKGRARRRESADGFTYNNLLGVLTTNAALLALLTALGHPLLYLLWPVAWLTTYSLAMRIRSINEHSMIADPADPLQNARTTLASWWERLLLAPNRVNYHLEHHLFMAVPLYRLPTMHRLLKERGVLDGACIVHGYANTLRLASGRP